MVSCRELFSEFNTMNRLLCSFYLMQEEGDARAKDIIISGGDVFTEVDFTLPLEQKLAWINSNIGKVDLENRFPIRVDFTASLNLADYLQGLWSQPKVWLRVRRGKMEQVKNILIKEGIVFQTHDEMPNAIQLDQGVSLDKLNFLDKGLAEVQDLSSQRTMALIPAKSSEHWYDACAASGGKSLMLMDSVPGVKLTVSDNREAILVNLKERFNRNGILNYSFFIADLTDPTWKPEAGVQFDGIIADVPCSGSGTWARTPEQMSIFDEEKLSHYISLQDKITKKLCSLLSPGGKLVYITCSVFKAENEDRVVALENLLGMKCVESKLYQGTLEGADTLFVALLEKK
ncbi:MAG: methyltransferase domain-containing protein [Bacteroidetes bacterium]|nr:methyltransferase domain-containing protein [Bacteroidota bacterium]